MQDIIRLLPEHIANQIAAGEVVQRPASVVKELMENSIDAQANKIQLFVKDAGKTLVQIIDDGIGMSEIDARMCFERHATSKILQVNDLYAIRTMGFRGEALASIAAVSQVELRTARESDIIGTCIYIEANSVTSQEPVATPKGTQLSVKNLFFNVPARRGFLKSNIVEMRHIVEEFVRIALAYPDKYFILYHNDIELYHLRPSTLRKRIVAVLGTMYNETLINLEENTPSVDIKGLIAKPESCKKVRGDQYFFVNNRFIKSPYLHHAVNMAYSELIQKEQFPSYVLFLAIDPSRIDVNVHPTKHEIKFEEERTIYTFLNSAIRKALGQFSLMPTLEFDQETAITQFFQQDASNSSFAQSNNNIHYTSRDSMRNVNNQKNWETLIEDTKRQGQTIPATHKIVPSTLHSVWQDDEERIETDPYQLHQRYIVSAIRGGFILVDQEAAHQRILYERFIDRMHKTDGIIQQQLFPKTIAFSSSDAIILRDLLDMINALGFDIKEFGKDTFIVHGIPADLEYADEQSIIEKLIEQYKHNEPELKLDKRANIAKSMALHASIKGGKKLNSIEMRQLMDELFACHSPLTSPYGRKTFIRFSEQQLHDLFTMT